MLLQHLRQRHTLARELGADADDDGRLWWAAADLAELGATVDVLLTRENALSP